MKNEEEITKLLILLGTQLKPMNKKDLIDAIASGSKLTKADAGRFIASMPKKEFREFLLGADKTDIIDAISMGAKLTKADAGRTLDVAIETIHRKLKTVFGGRNA